MSELSREPFYTGNYRHNLDGKLRVTVPSKWRFHGDEVEEYLAWPHQDGYIAVYPPQVVQRIREHVSGVRLSDARAQRFLRHFFGNGTQFTCDGQGRIRLSEKLIAHAGIEKEAVLVGSGNTFAIYAPERYEAEESDEAFDLSGAMEAMGI